tara:strand:- start:56 stop:316 length:261 start_codon:yes stop_codon:yes gene_type:complete
MAFKMNRNKASFPFKSGIADVKAEQDKLKNLEPLLGTETSIHGKTDYQMGFENDEAVAEERKHVKGTKHEKDFNAYHKERKEELRK